MTTIDELLGEEIEPRGHASPSRLTPLGLIVQVAILAASLSGVVWGVVRAIGYAIPYPLIALSFFALLIGWRVAWTLRAPASPIASFTDDEPDRRTTDSPFAETRLWVDRLDGVRGDLEQFRWILLPAIKALVDERLRLRYGITRYSHPDRAAEILGPRLVPFLDSQQLRRVPTPAELSALVKELEELS